MTKEEILVYNKELRKVMEEYKVIMSQRVYVPPTLYAGAETIKKFNKAIVNG